MEDEKQRKAFVLFSGGLDSQLAVRVLQEQGIYVEGIIFHSPFFSAEKGKAAAKMLGIRAHSVDFTEEILAIVLNPAHGFGKTLNPCIDCHAGMVKRAGKEMEAAGFDFIATGEVLGQRPMSQTRRSLNIVARDSGYGDVLLRPLSAALLDPVKPIREGWIDVKRLPCFSNRDRSPQVKLAKQLGITNYPEPAGGCLLTAEQYSLKLKDLIDQGGFDPERTNLRLLQTGRHLRLSDTVKIIVGTNQADNKKLNAMSPRDALRITCPGIASPTVIAPEYISDDQLQIAASICARYAKAPSSQPVRVQIENHKTSRHLNVIPMDTDEVQRYFIC